MDSSGAPCFSYENWNKQKSNDLSNGNSSNHNLQEIGQGEKQIDGKGSNQAGWCNPLGSSLPTVHSTRVFRDKEKPRIKSSTKFSYKESKDNEEKKAKN